MAESFGSTTPPRRLGADAPCGSELARDGGLTVDMGVEWASFIASTLAPTGDWGWAGVAQTQKTPQPEGCGVFSGPGLK
ncbi:hypothetical protein EMIT048CA2_230030 [Pseudomonas chlororaphis]